MAKIKSEKYLFNLSKKILELSENLDATFVEVAEKLIATVGNIHLIGTGKSAVICAKVASTFASIGLKAFHTAATDLSHGDLGKITNNDTILFISHSGNTAEILNILPSIKKKGCTTVSITSNKKSTLANESDYNLLTNVNDEEDGLGIIPTTSTSVTLAIGDALTIYIAEKLNLSNDAFLQNHPGGILGKKLSTYVSDVMSKEMPICSSESDFISVLHAITEFKKGAAIIVDNGAISGIVTDGDIRRMLGQRRDNIYSIKASDMINNNPITINQNTLANEALKFMEDKKISFTPVTSNEKLVGCLSIHDLIKLGL